MSASSRHLKHAITMMFLRMDNHLIDPPITQTKNGLRLKVVIRTGREGPQALMPEPLGSMEIQRTPDY